MVKAPIQRDRSGENGTERRKFACTLMELENENESAWNFINETR